MENTDIYTIPENDGQNIEEAHEDTTTSSKSVNSKSDFTNSLYEAFSVVTMSLFIMTVIFTFVFRLVGVNGNSMVNTLHDGEWLIVSPYYSEPEYGDIVISSHRLESMGPIVKRVIATEGDTVDVHSDGSVYVNGEQLDETSYAMSGFINPGDHNYPVTVPDGYVFLLGDNRPISADSRYDYVGFAPVDSLLGKAQIRLGSNWRIYDNFKK